MFMLHCSHVRAWSSDNPSLIQVFICWPADELDHNISCLQSDGQCVDAAEPMAYFRYNWWRYAEAYGSFACELAGMGVL
jgi:hypothetical protein